MQARPLVHDLAARIDAWLAAVLTTSTRRKCTIASFLVDLALVAGLLWTRLNSRGSRRLLTAELADVLGCLSAGGAVLSFDASNFLLGLLIGHALTVEHGLDETIL